MKAIKISLLALTLGLMSFSVVPSHKNPIEIVTPPAAVVWKVEAIEVGQIPQGTPKTIEFEFKNTSDKSVIITNVKPACGCTTSDYSKEPIAPGKSGFVKAIYKAFVDNDCSQLEINPLIETKQGDFLALDAKINFDSNALYRHPDIVELRDITEEDPLEYEASKHELNYIRMTGDIGCMVNGAGLAMATMDIIKLFGGDPANFLDVGGGATKERVKEAFKLILSDENVKGILVNIFGGIMRCDIIADGVINAAKEIGIQVPVVVRLEGTNADKGRAMLDQSGLNLVSAKDLGDAAQKIVEAVEKSREAA